MQRYTREELLRASGARADELADLEARRLLLPNRSGGLFGRGEPYYTASQLAVLRYLLRSRRSWESARRACPPGDPPAAAAPARARPSRPPDEGTRPRTEPER
jgi:hypothetical protein